MSMGSTPQPPINSLPVSRRKVEDGGWTDGKGLEEETEEEGHLKSGTH